MNLFLGGVACSLKLHLPCPLQVAGPAPLFRDNGQADWQSNPGRTANVYHRSFSRSLGRDSIAEIVAARGRGAVLVDTHKGFHARNTALAKDVDVLVAFSWGQGVCPVDGGTADTWRKCNARRKLHVPLGTLGSLKRPADDDGDLPAVDDPYPKKKSALDDSPPVSAPAVLPVSISSL